MIRVFSHYVSAKLVVLIMLEAVLLFVSVQLGRWFHLNASGGALTDSGGQVLLIVGLGLCMLVVMKSMGLYGATGSASTSRTGMRVIAAVMIALCVSVTAMHFVSTLSLGFDGLAIALITAITGSCVLRWAFQKWADGAFFVPRILLLGTGPGAAKLVELAKRNSSHEVVGCMVVRPTDSRENHLWPVPILTGESVMSLLEKYRVDEVVVAVTDRRGGALPVEQLLQCRLKGVRITELPTFFEREHRQVLLGSLNPSWMVFGDGFRQGRFRTIAKRVFDLVASGMLLVVTFPIMLVAALCIAIESGFPILYRQERVGHRGHVFTIYKLRSMKNGAESDGKPRWASANDVRTTRVGRVIRKLRIDELPQVFNVLKGDMSFVGPRPERPFFVDSLAKEIPYYTLRHNVKPGITGWAQVRYQYGASVQDAIEKLQYDLYYVKNHTLFLDVIVLIDTVEVVLWGGGSGAKPPQREQASTVPIRLSATAELAGSRRFDFAQPATPEKTLQHEGVYRE